MQKSYAKIMIEKKDWPKDKLLDYGVPQAMQGKLVLGQKVWVPLQNRKVPGFVVGFSAVPEVTKIRDILSLSGETSFFDAKLLELALWMKNYYLCTLGEVLNCLVPAVVKRKKIQHWGLAFPIEELGEKKEGLTDKQQLVLQLIAERDFMLTSTEITALSKTTVSPLKCLQKKGLITDRQHMLSSPDELEKPLVLNEEQTVVMQRLKQEVEHPAGQVHLLHGVTGSGKTEIYLQLIQHVLTLGKQAIVLVPEISLTPQTVKRFRNRFGESVAVLHSHLSDGERFEQWGLIKAGTAKIAVGARSALFAPFSALGLIVIDEEHEFTYKQEENPKYHARETAIKRAQIEQAVVVLASATPSLESFYRAKTGVYGYLTLATRIGNKPLPPVTIVDMREQLKQANRSVFSRVLAAAIKEKLAQKEQIILFLNRRGFSTFVMCRECGLVLTCSNCNVSLIYHQAEEKLKCHYCSYQELVPKICPRCSSHYIRYFGAGTEKVEEEVKKLFPEAKLLRMDRDTTTRKHAHEEILEAFMDRKADILLGTQMIAKGIDIPNVTLVGVIAADTLLNLPDFRAAEKTFQLLTQVSGRAGRGEIPGQVIIQTYAPEHYSICAAQNHDFLGFYEQEIAFRRELTYPPFAYLVKVVLKSREEAMVIGHGERIAADLRAYGVLEEVLGPVPAPISKVQGYFRWQILVKDKNFQRLHDVVAQWKRDFAEEYRVLPLGILIDIEPVSML